MEHLEFRILDCRKGSEVDVEISKGTERGIAVLKMFGPNSRKECTLMINKSRKHEAKFVKMLAVEIIKPMIDKFISGEGWMNIFKEITAKTIKKPVAKTDTEETKETTDTNFVSVRGKAVKLLKC